MTNNIKTKRTVALLYRILSIFILITFIFSIVSPPLYAKSASATILNVPVLGTMVPVTPSFEPAILKGINIHP